MGEELGLDKSVVWLSPHNPRWIELGALECAMVRRLLGDALLAVQHVGSTSIPGLDAKPILDIAALVIDDTPLGAIVARLTGQGAYAYQGDQGLEGGLLFVRETGNSRTVHLHVVEARSEEWAKYLQFHALLLHSPTARARYQDEKRLLAQRFPQDRPGYTRAKNAIIAELLGNGPEGSPSR